MKNYRSLFDGIDDFRLYANVSSSLEYSDIEAFVDSAVKSLIMPVIGKTALDEVLASDADSLKPAVAPLACMLATDELSVNFGSTGHTVSSSKNVLPASDMKVSAYREACRKRGYMEFEYWLSYMHIFNSVEFICTDDVIQYSGLNLRHPFLMFHQIAPAIRDICFRDILPVMGDMYDEIGTPKKRSISVSQTFRIKLKTYVVQSALISVCGADPFPLQPEISLNPETAVRMKTLYQDILAELRKLSACEKFDNTDKKIFSCI